MTGANRADRYLPRTLIDRLQPLAADGNVIEGRRARTAAYTTDRLDDGCTLIRVTCFNLSRPNGAECDRLTDAARIAAIRNGH
jgi:hypothetical protein